MVTPEDFQAHHEQSVARAAELKKGIVRAQSWDQIFRSEEEADVDFRDNLIDAHRFFYRKNDPRVEYIVEPHTDGEIHRITRDRGHTTTYQRLVNGDIALIFYYPDKTPSENLITSSIGNIDHSFTPADVIIPDTETVDALLEEIHDMGHLTVLLTHMRGKPATQGWEDTMLYNGHVPQRIGYRLFPDYAIKEFAEIKQRHPQFAI